MPGGFPLGLDVCNGAQIAINPASTCRPTVLTAPGSINTKGAYLQLIASTASDCCWALIQLHTGSGSGTANNLVDISVGAAASEVVVCSNLWVAIPTGGSGGWATYVCPLHIPAGSRVSARYQTDNISGTFQTTGIAISLFDGGFTEIEGSGGIDMLGVATGTSLPTTVTGAAGATTFGSFAQLIASTARDYIGVIPIVVGNSNDDFIIDFAIGAAASEQVIIPNIAMTATGSAVFGGGANGFFIPINIPAGTRVSARASSQFGGSLAVSAAIAGVYL